MKIVECISRGTKPESLYKMIEVYEDVEVGDIINNRWIVYCVNKNKAMVEYLRVGDMFIVSRDIYLQHSSIFKSYSEMFSHTDLGKIPVNKVEYVG